MMGPRGQRARGHGLAVAAVVVAVLGYAWILVLATAGTTVQGESATGTVQVESGTEEGPDSEATAPAPREIPVDDAADRDAGVRPIVIVRWAVLLGIPAISLGAAVLARRRAAAIVARGTAGIVLAGLTVLFITTVPVFALAGGMMAGATVLAILGHGGP